MNDKCYFPELDATKGIAIILMILGHCIQLSYVSDEGFFENIVFKLIYSFHMPLFMIISGFLFAGTVERKSLLQIIYSKVTNILFPILIWNFIVNGKYYLLDKGGVTKIKDFLYGCLCSFWFLWAVLFCSLVMAIIFKCIKNHWIQMLCILLGLIFTFITPDIINSECYKFMYPCFVFGYYMRDYYSKVPPMNERRMLIVLALVFMILFVFYRRDAYIYIGKWALLGTIEKSKILMWDIYRTLIGIIGSVCVILAVRQIHGLCKSILLRDIGKLSIGIYIISMYMNIILRQISLHYHVGWELIIAETIIVLLCSYTISKILSLNKYTSLLLGKTRGNR